MSGGNRLRVVITDPSGQPVVDARVMIEAGPGLYPDVAALSDAKGALTVSLPAPGRYRLLCAGEGFTSAHVDVEIGEQPSVVLAVTLDRAP